jgi:RNA polymerase sigma-70 factor (ECF subfamily)
LQPTALVLEAYIRLTGIREIDWQNRAHFFAVAAQLMRRILVDRARAQHAEKRGGLFAVVTFDEALPAAVFQRSEQLIELDEALDRLAELDSRQARIVELRFFTGLTEEETGDVLGISTRTVKREWRVARAWLYAQIGR